jgi:preprotein translocase subunit YajC
VTHDTLLAAEAATPAPTEGAAPLTGTKTETPSNQAGQTSKPTGLFDTNFLLMMLLMVGVLYFVLWRPQRKKQQDERKRHEEMLANLKKNDHVLVSGGIYGVVMSVGAESVTVKVDEKNDVRIRFAREAILRVVEQGGEGDDKPADQAKT